jgi:L-rhamnonate dehydratase
MKIKDIRAVAVDLTPHPKTAPRVPRLPGEHAFVAPMDRYPEHRGKRGWAPTGAWQRCAVVVTADDGTWGFGMTLYAGPVLSIINEHLAPLLRGEDVMATEKAYDLMNRATAMYGRTGLAAYAISAVDVALWDLKGKLLRQPVYALLGGPQKERIFCYASNTILAYGLEDSLRWCLELGFKATKVFLTHGPDEDLAGLNRNVEMVAQARQIVGPDVELAVDCWMALSVEYAVRLGEALRPYNVKWIEDCLLPEDDEGYARLRQRLPGVTLATGEHWYTSQPFAHAAAQGLVDIFQPDALWVGGITAMVKICQLADAFGLGVIAHAGMNYPFGQHLSLAMPAIAWGERSEGFSPPGVPLEEMVILPGTPVIVDGYLTPSDAPGFGLEFGLEWLEERVVG